MVNLICFNFVRCQQILMVLENFTKLWFFDYLGEETMLSHNFKILNIPS